MSARSAGDELALEGLMLATRLAGTPGSARHSSTPFDPSSAAKSRTPPTTRSDVGFDAAAPGLIPVPTDIWVPPAVPSLSQSSTPFAPSVAAKNRVPPTSVSCAGEACPGVPKGATGTVLMSVTSAVPPVVPSLDQSS